MHVPTNFFINEFIISSLIKDHSKFTLEQFCIWKRSTIRLTIIVINSEQFGVADRRDTRYLWDSIGQKFTLNNFIDMGFCLEGPYYFIEQFPEIKITDKSCWELENEFW